MNNLNSVLLEGNVVDEIHMDEEAGYFQLQCLRYKKVDTEIVKCPVTVSIKVIERLAEACRELKKDWRVRVVGRLEQNTESLFVFAEHVEIKSRAEGR